MFSKPTIYLLMEIKSRELEGKTLLALEAACRGFRVVLGNQVHLKRLIRESLMPPGVYFDKSLTKGKEALLNKVVEEGFVVASQDEESGLLDFSYDQFIATRSTDETVAAASAVFCWGEFDKRTWQRHYPKLGDHVYGSGSPRVDFWRPDFMAYYTDNVKDIADKYGDYVLIPSNFPLANGYMNLEQRIEQGRKNGSLASEADEQTLRANAEDTRKMVDRFAELLKRLSEAHPTINFIVRPHPVEKLSEWERRLTALDNVHVVFEGGVTQWVRGASAIIHNGCTTGIEARFSGVPTIAYVPFESPINREVPNAVSVQCRTPEAVEDTLGAILSSKGPEPDQQESVEQLLQERFANFRGDTASSSIVSALVGLNVPASPPPRRSLKGRKIAGRYIYSRFMKRLSKKEDHGLRKFSGLTLAELEDIRRRLSLVKPAYADRRIEHFLGDVFCIE
ncbi:hypothetical protein R6258_18285 [Halomonas sp. HP20-15]|uniref:surface carbohydrate biosynthesis protein n=1 Tax=Halomonas sp. HP20-15 TaxID=3085901 RepID=UPI0029816050|nr:surface carbohydrate biosynthesis protein [Halomonas sp. HP20-15]MDW5378870.1 hypothetical protein [Halomonas sp. HP20-15]